MKRKTKIITTIASLCLAVALMAFGVYAATSAVLGVTSKVQFTALDVDVTWNIKVSGGNVDPLKGAAANSEADDYQPWAAAAGYTLNFNTLTGQAAGNEGTAGENIAVALTPQGLGSDTEADDFYTFVPGSGNNYTGDTITYTFTMTNNGGDNVNIDYTGSNVFETIEGRFTATYKQAKGADAAAAATALASATAAADFADVNAVAEGEVVIFQVVLVKTDLTKSMIAQSPTFSFVTAKPQA